jgi:hypothetical protein
MTLAGIPPANTREAGGEAALSVKVPSLSCKDTGTFQ